MARGDASAGRFAGAVLVVVAVHQLTPLKQTCLRRCRSPTSAFTHADGDPARHTVAARIGALHGAYCLGCCRALMAILVAMGTMHLVWMAAHSVVIFVEKVPPRGEVFATAVAASVAGGGLWLLVDSSTISTFTEEVT